MSLIILEEGHQKESHSVAILPSTIFFTSTFTPFLLSLISKIIPQIVYAVSTEQFPQESWHQLPLRSRNEGTIRGRKENIGSPESHPTPSPHVFNCYLVSTH